MTLEGFRKACEYMKANKQINLIKQTKDNLEKKPDEERRNIFNEVFSEVEKSKKTK